MTTRKTLKDFLNSNGAIGENSISYDINNTPDGPIESVVEGVDLGIDPNTNRELLGPEGILGDYLKHLVDNSTNVHKFKKGNEESAPTTRGNSLQQAQDQGTETIFVEQDSPAFPLLSKYSNSGMMDDESGLTVDDSLDKVGETNIGTGKILSDVIGRPLNETNQVLTNNEGESIAERLTYQLLNNHNRFNPAKEKGAFKDNNTTVNQFETKNNLSDGDRVEGTFLLQNKFGKYDTETVDGKLSLEKLKGIGVSMLLRAGGWDSESNPAMGIDTDQSQDIMFSNQIKILGENKAITDKVDNLTVDLDKIRSKNSYSSPVDSASGDSLRLGRSESVAQRVKGQASLYNTEFNFTHKNSNLIKYQAAAALINIFSLFTEQLEVIENFTAGQSLTGDKFKLEKFYNGAGPYAYGTSKTSGLNIVDFFKKNILVSTRYSYSVSLKTGMKIMFGITSGEDNFKDVANDTARGMLDDSPGYWQSIAFTVIRRHKNVIDKLEISSDPISNFISLLTQLRENSILQFMNVLATIGDIRLQSTQGKQDIDESTTLPLDVDALEDRPSTRVMKGRKLRGFTKLERSTSQRSMPAAYLLPGNVIEATLKMGTAFSGQNPTKGMLGSGLADKTYIDRNLNQSFNKIPINVVKNLEDKLEGEYVPFYIHDLRTNEIVSFHAFLTKLTDTIAPKFDRKSGYGRLDDVQIYNTTTRTVDVGFVLHATSKEDFDEMWYKINKITTLLYPQWTQGTTLRSGNAKFVQPFSQVLGASPIVRLRVGDVIKSNYSQFNLARIHGLGDNGMNLVPSLDEETVTGQISEAKQSFSNSGIGKWLEKWALETFYALAGSPIQYQSNLQGNANFVNAAVDTGFDAVSDSLVNGFVNPLVIGQLLNQMKDPDVNEPGELSNRSYGYKAGLIKSRVYLKASPTKGYNVDGKMLKTSTNYSCKVIEVVTPEKTMNIPESATQISYEQMSNLSGKNDKNFKGFSRQGYTQKRTKYRVQIIDSSAPQALIELDFIEVYHSDLLPDYSSIFNTRVAPIFAAGNPLSALSEGIKGVVKSAASKAGIGADHIDSLTSDFLQSQAGQFISSKNNPITRAFESTMGRGLAGTIGNITFDWLDSDIGWETDFNSRAPMGCKIGFQLTVIHDIPPGLDHGGYNRAPIYNVGEIMKHVSGDPNERLDRAEFEYKSGESVVKKLYKK
tara:strand:+ start:1546 stop:5109 length:3564 start_codon:yes stop_codon:yes gene_type:complete